MNCQGLALLNTVEVWMAWVNWSFVLSPPSSHQDTSALAAEDIQNPVDSWHLSLAVCPLPDVATALTFGL